MLYYHLNGIFYFLINHTVNEFGVSNGTNKESPDSLVIHTRDIEQTDTIPIDIEESDVEEQSDTMWEAKKKCDSKKFDDATETTDAKETSTNEDGSVGTRDSNYGGGAIGTTYGTISGTP